MEGLQRPIIHDAKTIIELLGILAPSSCLTLRSSYLHLVSLLYHPVLSPSSRRISLLKLVRHGLTPFDLPGDLEELQLAWHQPNFVTEGNIAIYLLL